MYSWFIKVAHIALEYFYEYIYMPSEMKFSINYYNLMRYTRIIIDNRIYLFIPVDIGIQSRRK